MKFNLWSTKDGEKFSVPIDGGFADNQFPTIAKTQDAVETLCAASLEWITPEDTTKYDPIHGYEIHGSSSPDSIGEYNGTTYTITECEEHPRVLAEILPTVEALEYALINGNSGFSGIVIHSRIFFLRSDGSYGCPGAYTKDCKHNNSNDLLCYRHCPRFMNK